MPGVTLDLLGDIALCAPVIHREAAEQGKSLMDHWAHMLVHGMLHLRGFDHIEDSRGHEALEIEFLAKHGIQNPYERANDRAGGPPSKAIHPQPQDRDELLDLLRGAHSDNLERRGPQHFEGALQVSEMQVRDVMIPRSQVVEIKRPRPLIPSCPEWLNLPTTIPRHQ